MSNISDKIIKKEINLKSFLFLFFIYIDYINNLSNKLKIFLYIQYFYHIAYTISQFNFFSF
jgi:hypothetical protein